MAPIFHISHQQALAAISHQMLFHPQALSAMYDQYFINFHAQQALAAISHPKDYVTQRSAISALPFTHVIL